MLWCLHGALGSYRDWETLFPDAHHVDLYATDPGKDLADWANRWVTSVAEEDPAPTLVGYSMGGRLALHALLAAPKLWKRAIIVSAHPGLPAGQPERRAQDEGWLSRFQQEPFASVIRDWNAQPVLRGPSTLASPESFEPAMARCFLEWSLGNQTDLRDQLSKITCPVTWVCGENDPKFSKLGREAVPRLPRGEFVSAPNCGHRVPWEWSDFAPLQRARLRSSKT